jgi:hypothetical protein
MPDMCPNCNQMGTFRGDDETGRLRECTNSSCTVYLWEANDA